MYKVGDVIKEYGGGNAVVNAVLPGGRYYITIGNRHLTIRDSDIPRVSKYKKLIRLVKKLFN